MSATVALPHEAAGAAGARRPRLGFLGLGWIGRQRLDALAASGAAEIAALADVDVARTAPAAAAHPRARLGASLGDLLGAELDGLVIATPSALHAPQALAALRRGIAVFCQKPLARTEAEARIVVDAARAADRPLGVDLSYRGTAAMRRIRELVRGGGIGRVYAAEAVFHNAYGPDKSWCRDPRLSGGGCAIDLGTHLVDLARWTLGFPAVRSARSVRYAHGRRLARGDEAVEDLALGEIVLEDDVVVRLACSWDSPAGCAACIEMTFRGTSGAARFRNVDGSFYDFVAEHLVGPDVVRLCEPPDAWGGRVLVEWTERLGAGAGFDAESERHVELARTMDALYDR